MSADTSIEIPPKSIVEVGKGFEVYIPVEGLIDIEKETKRLATESKRLTKIIKGLEGKLGNQKFVANAPEEIITQTKAQHENLSTQLKNISENLKSLKD